jgi:serine/threonine protein kinase
MIGQTINGYRITEAIKSGGMATVYKSVNPAGFTKAFKVVRPDRAENNPALYRRFEKEINILRQLSEHPNIVRAENVYTHNHTTVLEMEYLDGMDLYDYVTKKTTNGIKDREQLSKISRQILESLNFAHNVREYTDGKGTVHKINGILHLDIKPNNIFRTRNGYVKLLDFGIAKVVGEEAEKIQGAENVTLLRTETGESTFKGAPAYASPEQQAGKALDITSDIFSFGKTLHFIATGSEDMDVDVTVEPFASIVKKCTEQRRKDRYQSCMEIIDAINPINPPPLPPTVKCRNPECGKMIDASFPSCPYCRAEQKQKKCPNINCPRKEKRYTRGDKYCNYCGTGLVND